MDLSAVIFVALALAWAVYLIPKALKHHDDMASDRLVEGHSDRVRILSRKARAVVADVAEEVIDAVTPDEPDHATDVSEAAEAPVRSRKAAPARSAGAVAARRRRRVLGLLLLVLVAVWGLTWFGYLPLLAPAVPGVLVVGWLVIARLSVRNQQRRRRPLRRSAPVVEEGRQARLETSVPLAEDVHHTPRSNADEFLDQLADEDTAGLDRAEIEAALASEGSLWDPLPMTLPTYVNKARARRTVRTIELTGLTSSGHDDSDSALAREAAAKEESTDAESTQRRVAGA